MNKKNIVQRVAMVIIFSLIICSNPIQATSATDLATFTFNKSDGVTTAKDLNDTYKAKAETGYSASSGKFASTSKLYSSVSSPSSNSFRKLEWSKASSYSKNGTLLSETPIMAASIKNPWGTTPYFLVKTSTKGYENLTFSVQLGGSKKGPRDYKLQFSLDGKNFANVLNTSIKLSSNKELYQHSFTLPDLAEDQSSIYFRIITTSTTTIEGGGFTSVTSSGETAINNLSIKGTLISLATASPNPTTKPNSTTPLSTPQSTNTSNTSTTAKTLDAPVLTTYKKGTKILKGTCSKKAKIKITVGKKKYTTTATKKGTFKVTIKNKLKKGRNIKLNASKSGFKASKTVTYTVK